MGYQTDFEGGFTISPPLLKPQVAYVQAFNRQRHMRRDVKVIKKLPNPIRIAAGLPVGPEGVFFLDEPSEYGTRGQRFTGPDADPGVLNGNVPPGGERGANSKGIDPRKAQPGLWCQWTVDDAGLVLEWDGGEKFYDYIEWLDWMDRHLFKRWDRKLNGSVTWRGEEYSDFGEMEMRNGKLWLAFGRSELAPAQRWKP